MVEGAREPKADWDTKADWDSGGADVPEWEQPMLRVIAKTPVGLAMTLS